MSVVRASLMSTLFGVFLLGTTCEVAEPCDRYVDYVCQCHEDDPQFDCQELRIVLQDADPAVQDQCAVDLADLQDVDEAQGTGCETDTGL